MEILLSVLGLLAIVLGFSLIESGISQKVPSCYGAGFALLAIVVITYVFYILNWTIPMIIIFGLVASLLTLVGVQGEIDTELMKSGIIECVFGMILYFVAFYYWYQGGWYRSMAFATSFLCFTALINSVRTLGDKTPIISIIICLIFAITTICLWRLFELNGYIVFLGGAIAAIILRILYEKFYGLIRGYEFRSSFLKLKNSRFLPSLSCELYN